MHAAQAAGLIASAARARIGTIAAIAGLVVLFTAGSAAAAPGWIPPQDLSQPGRDASKPVAAMAADGATVVVWERRDDFKPTHNLQVSTREPGAQFTAPVQIAAQAQDPVVAITPGGEAIAAWWHFRNPSYVIQAAVRMPGGSFSAPLDIALMPKGTLPRRLQLDVNSHGGAVIAWARSVKAEDESSVGIVEAAIRPPRGAFSTPVQLTEPIAEETAAEPAAAIDDSGRATVVWAYQTATERLIQASTATPAGSFSPADDVSEAGTPAFFPVVAAAPGGETAVLWAEGTESDVLVNAATRPPGGSFGLPEAVSDPGDFSTAPAVAMLADGTATALWLNREGAGPLQIEAADRPPGGSFGTPRVISTPGADTLHPSLAASGTGSVIASWSETVPAGQVATAAVRLPGGGFTAPRAIGPTDPNFLITSAAIADRGDATVVWAQDSGNGDVIRAAGFDAEDPRMAALSAPAQGTVGVPIRASMVAFDTWPAGRSIAFGDGAVAPGAAASHTYGAPGTYAITATITDPVGNSETMSRQIQILASNRFSIRKRHRNRAKGRIRLRLVVAGPGRVEVRGRGVIYRRVRAREAGPVTVFLRTKGKTRKRLNRKGRVRTTVRVSFLPDGGPRAERRLKLTFIKKLRKRRR